MHTGEKHCLCCKCGKRFKNRSGNTFHKMRCGGKVIYNAWFKGLIKGNQCQVCNRQFKLLSQLLVHYGVHNSEDCMKFKPQDKKQNVDARRPKGSMVVKNKRLSNSKGKNPVSIPKEGKKVNSINGQTCHICRKPFNSLSNLLEHIVVHTGDQNFSCSKCRKKFKWRVVAKYHSRSCDGEIIWRYRGLKSGSSKQCSICKRKFKLWTRLLIHIGKHEKAKTKHLKPTYQKPSRKNCGICGKEFKSSKCFKDHLLVHSLKNFRCVKCDKRFKSAKGKRLHETNCDGGKQELKADGKQAANTNKTHINSSTDNPGQSEDKEVSNSNTIDVDYTCHICKKRFRNITKLHEHLTVHTGEKNFACSKCGARYKWRGLARAHIQSCGGKIIWKVRYTGIKKGLDCKLCNKKFQYQSELLIHMSEHGEDTENTVQEKTEAAKTEQNNSKNEITCKICHRDFMSDSQLQQHLITHSNIKPFSCSWCLMRFKCEDSLQQHQVHFCPERKLALSK